MSVAKNTLLIVNVFFFRNPPIIIFKAKIPFGILLINNIKPCQIYPGITIMQIIGILAPNNNHNKIILSNIGVVIQMSAIMAIIPAMSKLKLSMVMIYQW